MSAGRVSHTGLAASLAHTYPGLDAVESVSLMQANRDAQARIHDRALASAFLVKQCSDETELEQLCGMLGIDYEAHA